MPIYEYECVKHGHKFEKIFALASSAKNIKCPKCGSKAEQTISIPAKRDPSLGIQR